MSVSNRKAGTASRTSSEAQPSCCCQKATPGPQKTPHKAPDFTDSHEGLIKEDTVGSEVGNMDMRTAASPTQNVSDVKTGFLEVKLHKN